MLVFKKLLVAVVMAASPVLAHAEEFTLTSPDIHSGARIAEKHVLKGYGCEGENLSPALLWKNAPAGTKSFALTVYDPDAPTGSGWWHWVVFNIPATTTSIAQGGVPEGAMQSRTDFGSPGYGGPCPPVGNGKHHYIFTVYALKTDKLDLDANASGASASDMINAKQIGKARLTAIYSR
jgi:Raf kinase inhibitor-like YbhB/YbcL family protein